MFAEEKSIPLFYRTNTLNKYKMPQLDPILLYSDLFLFLPFLLIFSLNLEPFFRSISLLGLFGVSHLPVINSEVYKPLPWIFPFVSLVLPNLLDEKFLVSLKKVLFSSVFYFTSASIIRTRLYSFL